MKLTAVIAMTMALVATAAPFGADARAEPPDAGATSAVLSCAPVQSPGRVRCEVEARVAPGESISWGDVVLVETPPFISPLRARIGPHDATTRSPTAWRWEFALVARGKGIGQVDGRVRLVVCRESTCLPRELTVAGRAVVGPDPQAADGGH
jgi:hypothetical protein